MTVIHKSPLEVVEELPNDVGRCVVHMPVGATLLKVGAQDGQIVFWYSCNPDAAKEARQFYVVPTGSEIPTDRFGIRNYFDTVQMRTPKGEQVWHVFTPQ